MENKLKGHALNELHNIQVTLSLFADLASHPNSNNLPIDLSDIATVLADNAHRMKQNLSNLD